MRLHYNYILTLVILIFLVCCTSQQPKNMLIEEYCQYLLNDSIIDKYWGYEYGLTRDNQNYSLKFPDSTWVYYHLNYYGSVKNILLPDVCTNNDSIFYTQKIKEIITYAQENHINTMESWPDYLHVEFDIGAICKERKFEAYTGVFIFCFKDINSIVNIQKINYYKPKKILPEVFYYEYK